MGRALRKKHKHSESRNTGLVLKPMAPMTEKQEETFNSYYNDKHLLLHGMAGTGKTFISTYLALRDVTTGYDEYKNLTIVRSAVPSRDQGFLPGDVNAKMEIYEAPYKGIVNQQFGRDDAYEILKRKNMINFISTSYLRGITLRKTIVLVDEIQNMTFHELDTVMTRLGEDTRIVFSGDFRQTDLKKEYEKNGLLDFMEIIGKLKSFEAIEFGIPDIVRSGLVKEYLIEKDKQGM